MKTWKCHCDKQNNCLQHKLKHLCKAEKKIAWKILIASSDIDSKLTICRESFVSVKINKHCCKVYVNKYPQSCWAINIEKSAETDVQSDALPTLNVTVVSKW